jgi:membrane protein implicated in regulation of membrane protease activity
MDATTKTLVQTTIALGAGVLVFRGIAAAAGIAATGLGILNIQLGRTAVLTALASGAAKGGWLVGLVGAAAAAATVYGVLNNNIKTTGEETEALSSKARELKDQIAQLQKEITDGKKLGIDTTDAQQRMSFT